MVENNPTNVVAALDALLEEIEDAIENEFVDRVFERTFEERDYEKVRDAFERVGQIISFRNKADALRSEWQTLFTQGEDEEGTEVHTERRNLGRLRRGLRTPEEAYYRPILEALEASGGSSQVPEVLDRVLQHMRGILKDIDYEPLGSDPNMLRWEKTAHFTRFSMVREGLLRSNSPRGLWEISDLGRQFLQNASNG